MGLQQQEQPPAQDQQQQQQQQESVARNQESAFSISSIMRQTVIDTNNTMADQQHQQQQQQYQANRCDEPAMQSNLELDYVKRSENNNSLDISNTASAASSINDLEFDESPGKYIQADSERGIVRFTGRYLERLSYNSDSTNASSHSDANDFNQSKLANRSSASSNFDGNVAMVDITSSSNNENLTNSGSGGANMSLTNNNNTFDADASQSKAANNNSCDQDDPTSIELSQAKYEDFIIRDMSTSSDVVWNDNQNSSVSICDQTYLQQQQQDQEQNQSNRSLRRTELRKIDDPSLREQYFKSKIEECCKIYDFTNDMEVNMEDKNAKAFALVDILDMIEEDPTLIVTFDCLYEEIFRMISVNIIRYLPPSPNHNVPEFDPDEDEPSLEPAWPHLEIVYEILTKFLDMPYFDANRAKPFVDTKFVLKLLELFQSEDPRERGFLKTALHRIYGRFLGLRSYIRIQINNIFVSFIYETDYHNGISDLLEFMGSVINGFVVPLKDEHVRFLSKVLLPLHKSRSLNTYHTQLTYCVVQFIEKDHSLTETVINGLLRYWPKVHSTKEVMFLNEIEEILDIIEPADFQKIMVNLFKQIARCIRSNQFQVAERVLYYWTNDYILSLINDNIQAVMPLVFPALNIDPNTHWNRTINGLIYNALKISTEMNQKLFHNLLLEHEEDLKLRAQAQSDKNKKWERVHEMAEENAVKNCHPTGIDLN